jgi:hypothetical protein
VLIWDWFARLSKTAGCGSDCDAFAFRNNLL